MRILKCRQGSIEWLKARIGVVTASEADNILTPGKLLPAKGTAYLNKLVAETVLGEPIDDGSSGFTRRGNDMEDEARRWYEFETGVTVERVGFVISDDERIGYSPDGLVGDEGLVEIKIPSAQVHAGYVNDPASFVAKYRGQPQFGLHVFEGKRKYVDLVSYNPKMASVIERVPVDVAYQQALKPALAMFLERLDAALARHHYVRPKVLSHAEREALAMSNPFLN